MANEVVAVDQNNLKADPEPLPSLKGVKPSPFFINPRIKFRPNKNAFDTQDMSVRNIKDKFTTIQVKEGSKAQQLGLKLGDSITKINNEDASKMSLSEAQKKIKNSGQNLKMSVAK